MKFASVEMTQSMKDRERIHKHALGNLIANVVCHLQPIRPEVGQYSQRSVTDDFIDDAYHCIASLGDKGDDHRTKNKSSIESLRPDLVDDLFLVR